ncbi:MAG TPA: Hsp20/alpha crystallin family protein [Candidatus Polarisedimenticolaceae bacterium]|nr:Hsp20/alpha crystallin family protein [Candidatus Polarisedimenticolaceae bacterium]
MPSPLGPLMEVARIQSEINRLFDNLLDLGKTEEVGSWNPNVDIVETETELLLKVELPGVRAELLELSVHGGNLILRGEKERPRLAGRAEFQLAERAFGAFRRVIHLGVAVNTHHAKAVLNNGLLRISFPKVPNRRGEAVPIEVHSE